MDTWRDGVYIEAGLVSAELYGDVVRVLRDPVAGTQMNDALMLHDPMGLFAQVQDEVRVVFFEPQWLGVRVRSEMEGLRSAVSVLREAVPAGDQLRVCDSVWQVAHHLICMPLTLHGTSPSSTRELIWLEEVEPGLKDRICDWEGSDRLGPWRVLVLLAAISQILSLVGAVIPSQAGDLPKYFVKKAQWLARNGYHREALHLVGILAGGGAKIAAESSNTWMIRVIRRVVLVWLGLVGWEGQEVLKEKVRVAEQMVTEVGAIAAYLPSDDGRSKALLDGSQRRKRRIACTSPTNALG